jgi:hypothetical protein
MIQEAFTEMIKCDFVQPRDLLHFLLQQTKIH